MCQPQSTFHTLLAESQSMLHPGSFSEAAASRPILKLTYQSFVTLANMLEISTLAPEIYLTP
ncbi:hypothetical protein PGT21_029417 [Puccinia graminis f. sp. tritici]|uniref:Uncharacterized protein n=1 Tax=Puccinia graminis f. sp. tritici TaxID=56615 RepID=A0A5B0Q4M5_PUCGR|nr:hypothetical protein PGT21_029417 [Puccinia graminis f. sp. tritici]KAA1108043.1 hypothetical protein PGTUg99_026213 [Puccinia graminis f. sp. tritici]